MEYFSWAFYMEQNYVLSPLTTSHQFDFCNQIIVYRS